MHTLINSCLIPSGRCMRLLTLGLAGRERAGEAAPGAANPLLLRIAGTNTEKTASRRTGGAGDICSRPQPRLRAVLQQQEESAAHRMRISCGVPPSGAPQRKQTGCYPPHTALPEGHGGADSPKHHPKTPGAVRGRPPKVAAVPWPAGSCPPEPPSGLLQEPGPVQNAAHVLQRNSSFDRLILPEP